MIFYLPVHYTITRHPIVAFEMTLVIYSYVENIYIYSRHVLQQGSAGVMSEAVSSLNNPRIVRLHLCCETAVCLPGRLCLISGYVSRLRGHGIDLACEIQCWI